MASATLSVAKPSLQVHAPLSLSLSLYLSLSLFKYIRKNTIYLFVNPKQKKIRKQCFFVQVVACFDYDRIVKPILYSLYFLSSGKWKRICRILRPTQLISLPFLWEEKLRWHLFNRRYPDTCCELLAKCIIDHYCSTFSRTSLVHSIQLMV